MTRAARNAIPAVMLALMCLASLLPAGCQTIKATTQSLGLAEEAERPALAPPPGLKVLVLDFLPLPEAVFNRERPHGKALTGEFHCDGEALEYGEGYFIPNEYMALIMENVRLAAALRGIDLEARDSLGGVDKGRYDIIVFAAVRRAEVTDEALVSLDARLVNGRTYATIETLGVNGTAGGDTDHPLEGDVHFIGEHGLDFQGQRTMLSLAAFNCAQDLLDAVIRRAGS